MRIEVQGHTDNKGKPAYNLKLSDRRAASVRKYLVKRGVADARLVSHGYGLTRPIVPNDTEQNRVTGASSSSEPKGARLLPRRSRHTEGPAVEKERFT